MTPIWVSYYFLPFYFPLNSLLVTLYWFIMVWQPSAFFNRFQLRLFLFMI